MLYVTYAQGKADSPEERPSVHPVHLACLQLLHGEGRLLIVGPVPAADSNDPRTVRFTGSTVTAEFEPPEAAQAWIDANPYVVAGAYEHASAELSKKVF